MSLALYVTPLPWKRNGSVAAAAAAAAKGDRQVRVSHKFCPYPLAPGTKLPHVVKYPELPLGSLGSNSGGAPLGLQSRALIEPLPGREAGQNHSNFPLRNHEPCYSIRFDPHQNNIPRSSPLVCPTPYSVNHRSFISFFDHCSVCTAKWPKPKQLRRGRKERKKR